MHTLPLALSRCPSRSRSLSLPSRVPSVSIPDFYCFPLRPPPRPPLLTSTSTHARTHARMHFHSLSYARARARVGLHRYADGPAPSMTCSQSILHANQVRLIRPATSDQL